MLKVVPPMVKIVKSAASYGEVEIKVLPPMAKLCQKWYLPW